MNDPKRILVVFLGLIVLIVCAFGIKDHMEGEGYKKQVLYTTAIKAEDENRFNYAVDSQQGNLLVHGTFATKKENLVKFPEMNKSFTRIERTKEEYTMHTETYECGDSKHPRTCTRTYWSWDAVDSNVQEASKISLYGREYNASLFDYSNYRQNQDCEGITAAGTGDGWFQSKKGCHDGAFYLDDDTRYVYSSIPQSFTGTFLASSMGGGLHSVGKGAIDVQNKSIGKVLHDVGKYKLVAFWTLIIVIILLCISSVGAAYAWVMEDGVWSLNN